jgi:PAS domain S-box-containing protein
MGVMEGDVVYDVEFRIVRPNGQERHLRASACPVPDGAGRPETLIGINIDVTEQKRRDERYRLLVENTGEAFTTVDLDGTVLMMNHAAAHDLGGEPEELVGRPLSEVCPADAACASLALLREVAQSGEGCEREWRLSAGDSVRWLEVRFRPVREDDGSVSSVLLLSSDITARKEAELAHARTESELQFIAENSLDVIAVFDSDLTPVYISPSAEEAFGYMPDELMEIDVRRAVHPHDLERLRGGIAETLKLKRTRGSRKARMYTKEGELRWFELRAHYVYDEDGEFDRVVVNARDVTERERMEEELRVALQEKGALMAEMNHRVKNNLSMVASLIRLKDQTLGECGDLSDIDRHVSAISLIHDRLYQANDTAEIMFGDFLDDLLSGTFALHSGPPVRVENEVGDALLLTKKAVILALIVNELAMNAVKHGFTREEPPVFRLSLRAEHERYSLAVYNSGRPFPDNVDLRTAGSLGLRLVSVLVDQLEGTIELQRRPHTEFTIRFPAD